MPYAAEADVYTAAELALASGAPAPVVETAVKGLRVPGTPYIAGTDAIRVGRDLRKSLVSGRAPVATAPPRRGVAATLSPRRRAIVSTTVVHSMLLAAAVWFSPGSTESAPALEPIDTTRLVFLVSPGPGGGGGGGGTRSPRRAPRLERKGAAPAEISVPPVAPEPVPSPAPAPEPLPAQQIVAPVVAAAAAADDGDTGVPGRGTGEGTGPGIGEGTGGGTGGGPYRPGSGIEPPRLLREVKATYTDEARRRNIRGDVVLEIVVLRDGTVGDVSVVQGLGAGLDQRAIEAVRQWRFAPARRLETPVDVIVEVAVQFNLR